MIKNFLENFRCGAVRYCNAGGINSIEILYIKLVCKKMKKSIFFFEKVFFFELFFLVNKLTKTKLSSIKKSLLTLRTPVDLTFLKNYLTVIIHKKNLSVLFGSFRFLSVRIGKALHLMNNYCTPKQVFS